MAKEKQNKMTDKLFCECVIVRQIDHYDKDEQTYYGGIVFRNTYIIIKNDTLIFSNHDGKFQGVFSLNKFFVEHYYE